MRILYPTHESGADELYVKEEKYWVWDLDKEKMISVNDSELQARRSGTGEAPGEEAKEEETVQSAFNAISVTVEKGDSLWKLAEEYYGDGRYWKNIYEANRLEIGEDPSLIYEGTILVIILFYD